MSERKPESYSKAEIAYKLYQEWCGLPDLDRIKLSNEKKLKQYKQDIFLVALAAVEGRKMDFPKID